MNKKNLLIAVAALLFSIQIQAQAPAKEKEQSNAEVFSSKAGTLMQKEFVEVIFRYSIVNIFKKKFISKQKTNTDFIVPKFLTNEK